MSEPTPFAQMPETPEVIILQVTQQVLQNQSSDQVTSEAAVMGLATTVVHEMWDSPVRTFIPVLATRQVQEQLRSAH